MDTPGTGTAETVFGLLALTGVSQYHLTSAGPTADPDVDRASRGLLVGILVFRSASTLIPVTVLAMAYGIGRSAVVLAIGGALIGLDLLADRKSVV